MGSIGSNSSSGNDKFNKNGELRLGKTVSYVTNRGITYNVRNDFGEYTVWKSKYVDGSRGNSGKWVDQFVKPTKEIRDKFKLER